MIAALCRFASVVGLAFIAMGGGTAGAGAGRSRGPAKSLRRHPGHSGRCQARRGAGSVHRLLPEQSADRRRTRAAHGVVAGGEGSGEGRRRGDQTAADRPRQRARDRQQGLCRARAAGCGRCGGPRRDRGDGRARARGSAQMAEARGRQRPGLHAAQAAGDGDLRQRAGLRCPTGKGLSPRRDATTSTPSPSTRPICRTPTSSRS